MRTIDYSPFYRATVGFDRVFDLLDNAAGQTAGNGYPRTISRRRREAYGS